LPLVVITSGEDARESGDEERLLEYVCDYPNCPYPAERVIGFAREIAGGFAVCLKHAAILECRFSRDAPPQSFGDLNSSST
jgi:hypothetical protein